MALSTAVGQFSTGTGAVSSTVAVTGLGFQPKIVIFWWGGTTSTTDAVSAASHRFGIGAAVSSSERFFFSTYSLDAAASSDGAKSYHNTGCVCVLADGTSIEGILDFVSMDAGGFTLVVDDQFANSYTISYLAIGGADLTNYKLGTSTFTAPAGTGNEAKTGIGFQPDALILLSYTSTVDFGTTVDGGSQISIGWGTGASAQGVMNFGTRDARPTMETFGYANNDEILAQTNIGSMVNYLRAALVSLDSDGFTLNWIETSSGYRYTYIALKGGRYLVGDLVTQTNTTTTVTETLGWQPAAVMFGSVCAVEDTTDTPHNHDRRSLGAATGASSRIVQAVSDEDNLGDSETANGIETDNVYLDIVDDAVAGAMDLTAVSSTGFSVQMTDADPGQYFVTWLAMGNAATQYTQSVSGGMTPAGTVANRAGKVLAGAITPDGALSRLAAKILAGGLAPDGAVSKRAATSMGGELTPAGVVSAIKTALISLGGALAPVGALALQTGKALAGAVTPDGTLVRSIGKALAGAITPDGGLVRQIGKVLAGALAGAGDLATQWTGGGTQYLQSVAGGLAPAGALALQTSKVLAGVLAPDGGLVKRTAKILAGALAPAGALVAALVGLAVPGRVSASETVVGGAAASEAVMGAAASETAVGGVTTTDG